MPLITTIAAPLGLPRRRQIAKLLSQLVCLVF
jgi:hypothetical protein